MGIAATVATTDDLTIKGKMEVVSVEVADQLAEKARKRVESLAHALALYASGDMFISRFDVLMKLYDTVSIMEEIERQLTVART